MLSITRIYFVVKCLDMVPNVLYEKIPRDLYGLNFSWTAWTWRSKFCFLPQLFSQCWHLNRSILSCTFWTWLFKDVLWPNNSSHIWHSNGLSFLWTISMCRFILLAGWNLFLQIGHSTRVVLSWIAWRWIFKRSFLPNRFSHFWHLNILRWTPLIWSVNLYLFEKLFSHR